jgi:putative tryptophan/tyrosine transport system substrate-binding protein
MDSRAFLAGTVGVLAAPLAAEAQPAGRAWRIGVLVTRDVRGGPEAFRQRLRDLGYFEGQNIAIEWRRADRGYDQLPNLAVELVRLRPDVVAGRAAPGTLGPHGRAGSWCC